MADQVRPFRSSTTEQQLADLTDRLARTRLARELSGTDWTHGTPPAYLDELVTYWRTEFDWPAAERGLNELPQFLADVDGDTLHFVHTKGTGPAPFPLLFTHGWPGSFWEVHKIIGPLTDPAAHGGDPADAFDLVAPSLPGYAFSPHPGRPGITPQAIGAMFNRLMVDVLGYPRYGAQGGDWGAAVTTSLGRDHGANVAGIHLNMAAGAPVIDENSAPLTEAEQEFRQRRARWSAEGGGYSHIQGTRPGTLGAALADSPAGLAAWIVEKFRAWSDCDGDVESVFSKDHLLTNITLYWLTNTAATSARLYYETQHATGTFAQPGYVPTPTGFAAFPKEIAVAPREWLQRSYNLVRFTEFERGGHFAALEQPTALVEDIREFFRPLRADLR
ncbi:MAG TPA: epoxide hydrolase [Pseudonocardiaceae bacterium]|nr:epoxide hydrolase [Pseudonocardiaceae bacterium]